MPGLKELKEELQGVIDKGLGDIKKQAENAISKEELKNVQEGIEKSIDEAKKESDTLKELIQKEVKTLKDIAERQGIAMARNKKEDMNLEDSLISVIGEQYQEAIKSANFVDGNSIIRAKAFEQLTHVVNDVTEGGVTATGVSEGVQNWLAQRIPEVAQSPSKDISWFQTLNLMPLVSGKLQILEMCAEDVNIQIIDECKIKPLSKVTPEVAEASAVTVPVKWKTSRQYRKMFSTIEGLIRMYFEKLIYVVLQDTIFEKLFANAVDFQNIHGEEHTNPDVVKLINAMITEMQTLDATPSTLFLNTVDYNLIKNTEDGQGRLKYQCCNGKLDMFNVEMDIVVRNFVPQGEVRLASMGKAYIATEDGLEYVQAYTGDDLDRNCITNRLESSLAVLVPVCHQNYFMKSTIVAGKALITA